MNEGGQSGWPGEWECDLRLLAGAMHAQLRPDHDWVAGERGEVDSYLTMLKNRGPEKAS